MGITQKPNILSLDNGRSHLIYIVTFLNFIAMSLISPLVNRQVEELGLSPLTIGTIGTFYGVAQFLSKPFLCQSAETFGAERIYAIAMISISLNHFVQLFTPSLIIFVIARSAAGLVKHTIYLGKAVLIELVERHEIPYAVGNYIISCRCGVILGPLIGGYLVHCENGGYLICFITAGIYLICFAILYLIKTPQQSTAADTNIVKIGTDFTSISKKLSMLFDIKDGLVLLKMLLSFCFVFANQSVRSSFSVILMGKYGISVSSISYFNSLESLVAVLVGFVVRPIISGVYKGDYQKVIVHLGLLHTISFIGQLVFSSFTVAAFSILLMEVASTFLWVALLGLTLECSQKVGSILMVKDMFCSLAMVSAPICAGILQSTDFLTYDGASTLGACASFSAVLCTIFFIPGGKVKSE